MRFFNFEIVIEKEAEDEGYYAWSPTLPGCFINGRTIEDAKQHAGDHPARGRFAHHGDPVPQNERLVHVEELAIGIP